jgi:hypothetical protein
MPARQKDETGVLRGVVMQPSRGGELIAYPRSSIATKSLSRAPV